MTLPQPACWQAMLSVFALWLAGCEARGQAVVRVLENDLVLPARAQFATDPSAEVLLPHLPVGATTSELALVSTDAGQLCFDIKLRVWPGGSSTLEVVVKVDEWNAAVGTWRLAECPEGNCVPADSPLRRHLADGLSRSVRVLGARRCVDAPRPKKRVEVYLGETGDMPIHVSFVLAPSSGLLRPTDFE